jgi:O-antigen/teichoic acid export membrane protein
MSWVAAEGRHCPAGTRLGEHFGMSTTARTEAAGFRPVLLLTAAYAGLSVLTLVVIVLFRDHPGMVTDAVWVRATLVVASSLLTFAFARSAARGSRKGLRRLRIVSAVMLAAIVVIVALPGLFPLWLRLEQAACGLLLLGVTVLVNGRRRRAR